MKVINGSDEAYKELEKYEGFIYRMAGYEYFGIKINDEYGILVDRFGKFIVAKFYKNYGFIIDNDKAYETYAEAEADIERRV